MRVATLLLAVAGLLVLGGCGNDDGADRSSSMTNTDPGPTKTISRAASKKIRRETRRTVAAVDTVCKRVSRQMQALGPGESGSAVRRRAAKLKKIYGDASSQLDAIDAPLTRFGSSVKRMSLLLKRSRDIYAQIYATALEQQRDPAKTRKLIATANLLDRRYKAVVRRTKTFKACDPAR